MSKLLKIALLLVICSVLIGTAVVFLLYRASQHVPDFYEQALELEPESMEKAGDDLERNLLALQNDLHYDGRWQAIFTDEQINGWLAADLAEKFPGLMPDGVRDPRVAIVDGQLQVACLHEGNSLKTIISFTLEPYLSENPNEVAVRIHHLRAGSLPLPMGKVIKRITHAANRAELRLQWAQEEGDPIALVTLPESRPELRRDYQIDQLSIRDGEIVVSGHTRSESVSSSEEADELEMAGKSQRSASNVNTNDAR